MQRAGVSDLRLGFAECISHGLTAWAPHSLGLIDLILSQAELFSAAFIKCGPGPFSFKPCKEITKNRRYSAKGFHGEFSSRARWEATSSTSVDVRKKAAVDWLVSVGRWVNSSLPYFLPLTLSAALNFLHESSNLLSEMIRAFLGYKLAAKSDWWHRDLFFFLKRARRDKERNREGVTVGRVKVQRVLFCQKQALTCRGLNDVIQRSAASQLRRKEMGDCEAET